MKCSKQLLDERMCERVNEWMRRREQIMRMMVRMGIWLRRLGVGALLLYRRVRYGYAFRLIRMAQPRYAKVDPGDYERLRGYEWLAKKGGQSFYALRRVPRGKGKKEGLTYMHQEVIEVGEGQMVDHINHDGMDNRGENLRAATASQNMCHRRKRSGATQSRYKGIYWRQKVGKWQAQITIERKRICLGHFRDEIEAAEAYDRAAIKYHGDFASLNFPD